MMEQAIFCWSGGKDASYALHTVLKERQYDVKYLLTTINSNYSRISMHGVREELLDLQARSIGIPVIKVFVGEGTFDEYEQKMQAALLAAKAEGITTCIFGDINLADLRAYREQQLAKVGYKAVFPLWNKATDSLACSFIDEGFKTIICCTNAMHLGRHYAGRLFDKQFVGALPASVDPCGENGEFHSFCFDGPIFKIKLPAITIAEPILRKVENHEFWYADLTVLGTSTN